MGISEFISKKKAMQPLHKRENISLQKPVVNLFAGDFETEEQNALIGLLNDRIGSSNKVLYGKMEFWESRSKEQEPVRLIRFPGVAAPQSYDLKNRENLQKEVQDHINDIRNMTTDYVNDIFNEVSTASYAHKARIRLNILVKPECMDAAALPLVLPVLKDEFSVYFPNGVLIDVYAMLDQKGYRREEGGDARKAFTYLTLKEMEQLQGQSVVQMPFCLSNYTTEDCLNPDCIKERMITAGLMMLVKDGASAQGAMQADTYDDAGFIEDCKRDTGKWYSLGHFKLEVATDLIDYIVYHAVMVQMQKVTENLSIKKKLSQMEVNEEQIDQMCGELLPITNFPPQFFYSMVKNSSVNVAGMVNRSRGSVINDVYGNNLELFFRLNCAQGYQDEMERTLSVRIKKISNMLSSMYEEEGYTLADMNAATNELLEHLKAMLNQCNQLRDAVRKEMDSWLEDRSGIANLREVIRDTGEPKAFYQLASEYLDKRVRDLKEKMKSDVLTELIGAVKQTAGQYLALAESLSDAVNEIDQNIQLMEEEELKIKSGNCRAYYTGLTEKILNKNEDFSRFVRSVNGKICSGELEGDGLFNEIINYCDEKILSDDWFEEDFAVEMLKRLKNFEKFNTEESIYDFAFETIMNNQTFYANYVSFESINREVCFLVNPGNRFVTGTNQRMQKLKASRQMKVFFEEHFYDMDILFMEGCFDLESLYNYQVYENIYNRMKQ
jgi:hypothetical protein